MLLPLISARLHGWLDEVATAAYLGAAFFMDFEGSAFVLLLLGACVHFINTRLTDYPQGQFKAYSLATHLKMELLEGIAMLLGAAFLAPWGSDQQLTLSLLAVSQIGAVALGDTRDVPTGLA